MFPLNFFTFLFIKLTALVAADGRGQDPGRLRLHLHRGQGADAGRGRPSLHGRRHVGGAREGALLVAARAARRHEARAGVGGAGGRHGLSKEEFG